MTLAELNYDQIVRVAKRRARRLRGNRIEWRDLAQEAAVRILAGRRSIEGPMTDILRKGIVGDSRRTPNQTKVPLDNNWAAPQVDTLRHYLPCRVRKTLAMMTERERKVVELLYYQEYTTKEVGLRLGVCARRVLQLEEQILRKLKEACRCRCIN